MKKTSIIFFAMTLIVMYASGMSGFAQGNYKSFEPSSSNTVLFVLSYDNKSFAIESPGEEIVRYYFDDLTFDNNEVSVQNQIIFDNSGLHHHDKLISFDRIYGTIITLNDKMTKISFIERSQKSNRVNRMRRGNLISPFAKISVGENDFVRGIVFSVTGKLEIRGEVNKDIISLFGEITVKQSATIRGSVLAMRGAIDFSKNASIYGELYSSDERVNTNRHRSSQSHESFSYSPSLNYNRVDGLGIYFKSKYEDFDSLLPMIQGSIGYGLESERGRYQFNIEQILERGRSLVVGASIYRSLESQDDWILPDLVNSFYAVIAKEDLKDYYESEGFSFYTSVSPIKNLSITGQYRNEQTNWLGSNQNLWSLFGGDKLFDKNFGTVNDVTFRDKGIEEIDTSKNVTLSATVQYDDRDKTKPFPNTAFAASFSLDWSDSKFDSDFNFRRYNIELIRYQKLSSRSIILSRFIHGNSDGYLPMHQRYYLGGLGSLPGYRQKELISTRFWMINSEYRFLFPQRGLGLSILYDIGQIANEQGLGSDIDLKQSLGLAVNFGQVVRVSLARRLDRSFDNNPRFHVRFTQAF